MRCGKLKCDASPYRLPATLEPVPPDRRAANPVSLFSRFLSVTVGISDITGVDIGSPANNTSVYLRPHEVPTEKHTQMGGTRLPMTSQSK